MKSKFLYQIVFWIFGFLICFLLLSYRNSIQQAIILTIIYAPVSIGASFIINKRLIPIYLFKKEIVKFVVYLIYTIIGSVYIVLLLNTVVFIYVANYKYALMPPAIREVVIIFSILYLLIFLFTTFESLIKWTEANRLKEIAESAATKAELKSLKSQLNPHFLFNTMNSIYALALKKSDKTPEMVLKLSELLDYTLMASANDFIEIERELEAIENLVYIEKVRRGSSFEYQLTQIGVLGKNLTIPPLMLLSIVENGTKHGDYRVGKSGVLTLDLKLESGRLWIVSRNPIDKNKIENGNGLGLKNLKEQLNLLYQDYDLRSFKENNFYQIEISILL